MFTRSSVRQALVLAFTLTATATAFAEQPRHGYRDSIVSDSCVIAASAEGAGYRDALARVPSATSGAVASQAAGYRDAFVRGPSQQKSNVQFASAAARACVH